jgi:hypothetical protein
MKDLIEHIKTGDRTLYVTGLVHLMLAILFLALIYFDQRTIPHENVWMKPFRFAVSIFLFTCAYAWISRFYTYKRLIRFINYLIAICMFIEIALISMQAFRGVPSHFNSTTPFDVAVYSVMGGVIGFNAVLLGILFVIFTFFERGGGTYRPAVIWGMILLLLGNFTGYLMVQNFGAVTGEHLTETGWFITNWNPDAGDFRIAHFLGLHGIQVVPLAAFLIFKLKLDSRLVHFIGAIYLCVLLYSMVYPLEYL